MVIAKPHASTQTGATGSFEPKDVYESGTKPYFRGFSFVRNRRKPPLWRRPAALRRQRSEVRILSGAPIKSNTCDDFKRRRISCSPETHHNVRQRPTLDQAPEADRRHDASRYDKIAAFDPVWSASGKPSCAIAYGRRARRGASCA